MQVPTSAIIPPDALSGTIHNAGVVHGFDSGELRILGRQELRRCVRTRDLHHFGASAPGPRAKRL